MKFIVQMKDPDTMSDAVADAVSEDVEKIPGLDKEERQRVAEQRRDKVRNLCARWFEYGEYLRVEIDTEAETCTVLPVER